MSREAPGAPRVSGLILAGLGIKLAGGRPTLSRDASVPEHRPGEVPDLEAIRHTLPERRLAADRRRMTPPDFRISPESPVTAISGRNTPTARPSP
ncbi:MAG: hypothetical protein LBQ79_10910 [Deltaproteobacteria bacterium]|nr:hypothetical protein [Deltaproteobacteria bacterium]